MGALGVAVTLILWGLDKLSPIPPKWLRPLLGIAYILVGLFWFYIAYIAAQG